MATNHKDHLSFHVGTEGAKYEPRYEFTEKIEGCLDSIERGKHIFNSMINPKYAYWLRRRAFIRSGHHTLHMEGNTLAEDQVADILENTDEGIDDNRHKSNVRNWSRAMQYVNNIAANPDIPLNSLIIQTIHSLILGQNDKMSLSGDYRNSEARVRHPISRKPVCLTPAAGNVPNLMHQLGIWLSKDASSISPVLAAGIAHLRLVEIHPFLDGNGRTARALTTLILQRSGYSFNGLVALERYFDIDLLRYCETISATVGKCFEEGRDLTKWLEYFTFALSVEVSVVSDAITDLHRMMEKWHKTLSNKGYAERHRDILAYARINGSIRPRDVMKIANVSAVTASDDLRRLTNAGLLDAKGQSRARVYRPSEDFWEQL